MTFISVGIDGTAIEFDEFITETGVNKITTLTQEAEADIVSQLLVEFDVAAIPTFVSSNNGNENLVVNGWNEEDLRSDLDWIVAN